MESSTQRFLVIRLSSIGDIVHALPAVAALGKSFPQAEIHWLIEARYAGLVEGNPFVHRVLKIDTLKWRHSPLSAATLEQVVRAGSRLREGGFNATVDFQGLIKSAFLARFSRAPERLGFSEPWLREPTAGLFYTQRVSPRRAEGRHVIELNLALVERLGARVPPLEGWRFPLPQNDEDDRYVEEQLAAREAQDFVVVNPGGGWKGKRWPPANFAELVRRLEQALPWKILLTGSTDEEPVMEEILARAAPKVRGRANYLPTTLRQFIALVRRARLFVGGDTGPMHLAAAAGTPVVAMFNAADPRNTPERNGPFSPRDITLTNRHTEWAQRRNKHGEYLEGISVDAVLEAVRERLARAYE